jgi:hypothetical protein
MVKMNVSNARLESFRMLNKQVVICVELANMVTQAQSFKIACLLMYPVQRAQ